MAAIGRLVFILLTLAQATVAAAAAAAGRALSDAAAAGRALSESDDCHRGDVQKMFISAVAGALLALAIIGGVPKRDANTWTRTGEASSQTYEEPVAPPALVIPPTVEYLPLPLPLPPPPSELVYDLLPRAPTATAECQTVPSGVSSSCQTDWHGAPSLCHRRTQTMPAAQSFPAGVQTVAVPSLNAFSQTSRAAGDSVATQCDPPGADGQSSFAPPPSSSSSAAAATAAESPPRTGRSLGRMATMTAIARTQTEPVLLHTGVQTSSTYTAPAYTQTDSGAAVRTQGCNTIVRGAFG